MRALLGAVLLLPSATGRSRFEIARILIAGDVDGACENACRGFRTGEIDELDEAEVRALNCVRKEVWKGSRCRLQVDVTKVSEASPKSYVCQERTSLSFSDESVDQCGYEVSQWLWQGATLQVPESWQDGVKVRVHLKAAPFGFVQENNCCVDASWDSVEYAEQEVGIVTQSVDRAASLFDLAFVGNLDPANQYYWNSEVDFALEDGPQIIALPGASNPVSSVTLTNFYAYDSSHQCVQLDFGDQADVESYKAPSFHELSRYRTERPYLPNDESSVPETTPTPPTYLTGTTSPASTPTVTSTSTATAVTTKVPPPNPDTTGTATTSPEVTSVHSTPGNSSASAEATTETPTAPATTPTPDVASTSTATAVTTRVPSSNAHTSTTRPTQASGTRTTGLTSSDPSTNPPEPTAAPGTTAASTNQTGDTPPVTSTNTDTAETEPETGATGGENTDPGAGTPPYMPGGEASKTTIESFLGSFSTLMVILLYAQVL